MKQLIRLQFIYNLLQKQQLSLNDIIDKLKKENDEISRRQLERDILDVKEFFLQKNEHLQVIKAKRTNYYHIVSEKENSKQEYLITHSNFYVINKTNHFEESITLLKSAITNRKYILILELKNDLTGDNYIQTTEIIEFAPIKLLNHRGTLYILGFKSTDLKELIVYEIEQLESFVMRKNEYNFKLLSKRADAELNKRFGVTKNIDQNVYDIELEFTNVLGGFIKNFHWHNSQKFHQKSLNNTLIMNLKCGINRELLGWLCQWMYNVRIISPPLLKEYYDKTLSQMQSISLNKKAFVYKNIFEPKNN